MDDNSGKRTTNANSESSEEKLKCCHRRGPSQCSPDRMETQVAQHYAAIRRPRDRRVVRAELGRENAFQEDCIPAGARVRPGCVVASAEKR